MAATNSNSSDEPQTFKPFSWLSADAQYLPLASFAAKTFDIAQGIGLMASLTSIQGLVGTLFGLARVSSVVEGIKEAVDGRLLVFFPGEHHPENHTYRLLDARDGWNYLAVPLLAQD